MVLKSEYGTKKKSLSKVGITFYPWVPLCSRKEIPCSADWVITIVEPMQNLKNFIRRKLMEETKVIKVLLLSSQEIVVSEIEEIAAEFGDPNCKLTKPYKIEGGALHKWMEDYTEQNEVMINSDKIVTLVTPSPMIFEQYSKVTS